MPRLRRRFTVQLEGYALTPAYRVRLWRAAALYMLVIRVSVVRTGGNGAALVGGLFRQLS